MIDAQKFDDFRKGENYTEYSVVKFAEEQGIAPGIVVGRLQRERLIKYSMLSNLKEKYEIAV